MQYSVFLCIFSMYSNVSMWLVNFYFDEISKRSDELFCFILVLSHFQKRIHSDLICPYLQM